MDSINSAVTDSFLPNKMEELQKQAKLEKIVEKENLAKQFNADILAHRKRILEQLNDHANIEALIKEGLKEGTSVIESKEIPLCTVGYSIDRSYYNKISNHPEIANKLKELDTVYSPATFSLHTWDHSALYYYTKLIIQLKSSECTII